MKLKYAIILMIMLVFCFAIILVYKACFFEASSLAMTAEKLPNKPENYFVITIADPVLLKAISNLGEPVFFNSMDDTQIDDLTAEYMTSNVEYNNSYYSILIGFGDRASFSMLLSISLIVLLFAMCLIIYFIIKKRNNDDK